MTHQELATLVQKARERMFQLEVHKGKEYTRGSEDRLANFKRVAAGVGLTPLQVWWVYAHKHWDSIASFIKEGKEFSSESVESRIDDLQVYLDLLRGLVEEYKHESRP